MSVWHIMTVGMGTDGIVRYTSVRQVSEEERASIEAASVRLDEILDRLLWRVVQHNYGSVQTLDEQIELVLERKDISTRRQQDILLSMSATAIVNFLAAMRMYLEQSEMVLKRLDREDARNRFAPWKSVCSAEYDDHFAYRFLDRFRNYVLHVGQPIHRFQVTRSVADPTSPNAALPPITRVFLSESPSELLSRYSKWNTVKPDLESLTTPIDILEQIGIAMECLVRVEQAYIEAFLPELGQAADTLRQHLGNPEEYQTSLVLATVPHAETGQVAESHIAEIDLDRFGLAHQIVMQASAESRD